MDESLRWDVLESEYISKHIYFTARKDRCRRQDGVIVDPYFVVELPLSATALAITADDQVLLVKQYRHPVGEVLMETPGGFIDEGESGVEGMRRELLEETGHHFPQVEYLGQVAANPGVLNNYTHLYLATGGMMESAQQLDHNEEIDLHYVPLQKVIEMLMRNEIKQSLHVNCLFYALMKMGRLKLV